MCCRCLGGETGKPILLVAIIITMIIIIIIDIYIYIIYIYINPGRNGAARMITVSSETSTAGREPEL